MTQWPIGLLADASTSVRRPSWSPRGGSPSLVARRVVGRRDVASPGGRDAGLFLPTTRSSSSRRQPIGARTWIAVLAAVDVAIAAAVGAVIFAVVA